MAFSGVAVLYKPSGMTSHDVVDAVRRITGERRVGHAGTLDPLARGVLIVAVGREATKSLSRETAKEKEYLAEIRFGEESETDDAEGAKRPLPPAVLPTAAQLRARLADFVGAVEQVPPVYSAVRVRGERAYRMARRGAGVTLGARRVEIKSIELLSYEWPVARIRVVTGPGVYVRALARDVGRSLGTGAWLSDLERTRVGEHGVDTAMTLAEFRRSCGT